MKALYNTMIVCGLLAVSGNVGAADLQQAAVQAPSIQSSSEQRMGIIVGVDATGHVLQIQHAQKLPPEMEKMLRETVNKWITKPAIINGRRAESAVFMDVALHTKQRADGNYEAYFTYISSRPAPLGDQYYSVVNGNIVMTTAADQPSNLSYSARGSGSPSAQTRPSYAPERHNGGTH